MVEISRKVHEIEDWLGEGSLNFFGLPFAGKDTNAAELAAHFGVEVLGGGHILRNSIIPEDIQMLMDSGELIPSEDYSKIVLPFLGQTAFRGKPLILSSVGRVGGEEIGVLRATKDAGHPTLAVPYLHITIDEARNRHSNSPDRGRADDSPESLEIRFKEFEDKTVPVIKAYEEAGLLVPINAMQDKVGVFNSLVNELHDRAVAS